MVQACSEENCVYCLSSCVYFFFCHAVDSILLHICCYRCLRPLLRMRRRLVPTNGAQKVYAFCLGHLSNMCASAVVLFNVWWAFLRPFDVTPMLGACTVNEFQLEWPPVPAAMAGYPNSPHLCFNLSTHLLCANTHRYYSVGYDHPAAAVFYAGEKLGPADDAIPAFWQQHGRSDLVNQVVVGRRRNANTAVVDTFTGEMVWGRFDMVLRIRVTLTYQSWLFMEEYFTFYDCPLASPVPRTG